MQQPGHLRQRSRFAVEAISPARCTATGRAPVWGASLIDDINRLGLLLLDWQRVADNARNTLFPAAAACRRAERALLDGEAPSAEPVAITATGAARPAGRCDHPQTGLDP
jgi:hypothetical protein